MFQIASLGSSFYPLPPIVIFFRYFLSSIFFYNDPEFVLNALFLGNRSINLVSVKLKYSILGSTLLIYFLPTGDGTSC